MVQFVAYIDEAGDEGLGKLKETGKGGGQSRWFSLGCCIVNAENDRKLPALRNGILARFPQSKKRELHFRNLTHEQKVVAAKAISEFKIGICVVCSNKSSIPESPKFDIFKRKQHLYNYLVRYMLERITKACHATAANDYRETCSLRVVFSQRKGTNYEVMQEYLELLRSGREVIPSPYGINWKVFNPANIAVENHSNWAGLQIADICTSGMTAAIEPNFYGEVEPTYARILAPRLLRQPGSTSTSPLNFGLTPVPPVSSSYHNDEEKAFLMGIARGTL